MHKPSIAIKAIKAIKTIKAIKAIYYKQSLIFPNL